MASREQPSHNRALKRPWPAVHPELPNSRTLTWPAVPDVLAPEPHWLRAESAPWYERRGEDGTLIEALRPPLVLLDAEGLPTANELIERAETGPGRFGVLLLQAGAAALGLFHDDEVLDHKAIKRYVVRGKGRAQPTHLKTRGKSRMGSRLRLRNAERLLEEVSERLGSWWDEETVPTRLFVSAPVRLYADLARAKPPPPVGVDDPRRVRIPLDVNVPTHAELMRVHRSMCRARHWWA